MMLWYSSLPFATVGISTGTRSSYKRGVVSCSRIFSEMIRVGDPNVSHNVCSDATLPHDFNLPLVDAPDFQDVKTRPTVL